MAKKCIGCGATLQADDKTKPGYVVPSKMDEEGVLCRRCFRLKNYGEVTSVGLESDDYLDVIQNIEPDALIIYIVDLFDFNGSFVTGLNRILYNHDIILIGNKMDLFPKSVKPNRVRDFVNHQAIEYGLSSIDCEVISSEKGYNIDKAVALINKYQKGRNVYVVGCTNVGKSSFINRLLKEFTGVNDVITTSVYPGTTLSTIEIEMNGAKIIDTPGLVNDHQLVHFLDESIKDISPSKVIKPIIYQVEPGKTLFIAGFCRIDLVQGQDVSFVLYKANALPIHKTKTEKADDFYMNHVGKDFTPPRREELEKLGKFRKQRYSLKPKQDIVISGLGFVTANKRCVVDVYVSENVKVFIREAII